MRIQWVDSWRGILIFLVVLGHLEGMCYHFAPSTSKNLFDFIYKIIYSFHMPAFFLLGGLLWSAKVESFGNYFLRKARRLIAPYLFWGFFSAGIYVLGKCFLVEVFDGAQTEAYVGKGSEMWWMPFLSILHAGGWPNGHGFQCNSVLWFLPAIFTVEIVFFWIGKFSQKIVFLLVILGISLSLGFFAQDVLAGAPWGMGLLFWYMPYFIVGRVINIVSYNRFELNWRWWNWLLLVTLFCVHFIVCFVTPNMVVAYSSFAWYVVFFIIALLGVLTSAVVARLFDCTYLQRLGRASLVIMLFHKFIILFFMNIIPIAKHLHKVNVVIGFIVPILVSVLVVGVCQEIYRFLVKRTPKLIGENNVCSH